MTDVKPQRIALTRRRVCGMAAALLPAAAAAAETAHEAAAWAALREGAIVLFRHAHAAGVGDPPQFRLGDCSTQRNLDDSGRAQSRRLGERLTRESVEVGAVWASQWCRTRETAEPATTPSSAIAATSRRRPPRHARCSWTGADAARSSW